MKIVIARIGSVKEAYYREAAAEYRKRLSPYASLEEIELKPARTGPGDLSPAEISAALEKEEQEFQKLLDSPRFARACTVALCIEGKQLSSEEFASFFRERRNKGESTVLFLIGGSWGMSQKIKDRCAVRLSFSRMTFAHSLFAVLLSEQIYRAFSILEGSGYHK